MLLKKAYPIMDSMARRSCLNSRCETFIVFSDYCRTTAFEAHINDK